MMKKSRRSLVAVLLTILAALAAPVLSGQAPQQAPPDQPFKTVHLVTLPAGVTENAWMAGLTDVNQAIAKAGCQTCIYHVFKVYGEQAGNYAYIQEAAWPGRAVYEKIHTSPEYTAARKRHAELDKVMEKQVYNRYVEVQPLKK
jgi:hypothetical protein